MIRAHDSSKLVDVQIRVFGLQRVVCPLDQLYTALTCCITLSELQTRSNSGVPIVGMNRHRQGVPVRHSLPNTGHCIQKCDDTIALKCTQHQTTNVCLDKIDTRRQEVYVVHPPCATLQFNALLEFRNLSER